MRHTLDQLRGMLQESVRRAGMGKAETMDELNQDWFAALAGDVVAEFHKIAAAEPPRTAVPLAGVSFEMHETVRAVADLGDVTVTQTFPIELFVQRRPHVDPEPYVIEAPDPVAPPKPAPRRRRAPQ